MTYTQLRISLLTIEKGEKDIQRVVGWFSTVAHKVGVVFDCMQNKNAT